ncbi:hypothetical protein TWF481_011693 [Arthrobotrys musiformis]|uniref:F-box domain-containing protein n=1 Tax=Arthrobotrys musiformis TaxID=47236 RepID=A0AAV9W070_9PEZI
MAWDLEYQRVLPSQLASSFLREQSVRSDYRYPQTKPPSPLLTLSSFESIKPAPSINRNTDSRSPLFLSLPYELLEKVALELTTANDTLSLANSCTLLRSTLTSSNYLWYRLLNLSGSVEKEYDVYRPERNYFRRVVMIRQGMRMRCKNCLGKDNVRTVDCSVSGRERYCYPRDSNIGGSGNIAGDFKAHGGRNTLERGGGDRSAIFLGVYCAGCLEEMFYDIESFESMQDKSWDGIINPPIVRLPEWLTCKALSAQYVRKRTNFIQSNNLFSTEQNPIPCIPKIDARALTDAATDDEATDEVLRRIELRNERLALQSKRNKREEKEFVLDYMAEAYEDFYEGLHNGTPVHEFKEWWAKEVFGLSEGGSKIKDEKEFSTGRSSKDPVRQILLRAYARRSSNLEISRWAQMLHDIGPGFKMAMKENIKSGAKICSFGWLLEC